MGKYSFLKDQRVLLLLVIVAIIVCVSCVNPRFIATRNLLTILQQISVLGILTMAMTLLLIGGGIDLSIGNLMILTAVVMAKVFSVSDSLMLALMASATVGILCGALNGIVIALSRCIPLIITLGTMQVFYGLSLTISQGRIMSFGGALNGIGKTKLFEIFPLMLLVLFFMVIVSYVVLNKTKYGRRLVALGGNEKNAYLSGIPIIKYKVITYSLAGLFCSVAGVIFASRIDSVTANAGIGYETQALTAAIIGGVTFDGGKGTIVGAFLGCLLMGVISNAMNILQVDSYIQTIITGSIIVCAVVLSNLENIKKR